MHMFRQEEERTISVRSDDNACPRLAESNLPMVPRQRIVRPLSLSYSSHLTILLPRPTNRQILPARQTSPTRRTACY